MKDNQRKKISIVKKMETLSGLYWYLITIGYLGYSLFTMRWHMTWIVWPAAGLLFAVITGITKLIMLKDAYQEE